MRPLIVIAAPEESAAGILDVLTDLSAAGLVADFWWLTPREAVPGRLLPVVGIRGGRRRPGVLQDVLADVEYDVVRLCMVVPLAGAGPMPAPVERHVAAVVAGSGVSCPVVRVRAVVGRPGDHAASEDVAREGWHNVLIAPEEAHGPASPRQVLAPGAHPVEVGRHAAPVLAGLVGLWSGLPESPLDEAALPPGPGARLGRAFYRRVDARALEQELRVEVLRTFPRLPLPSEGRGQTVHLEDIAAAGRSGAEKLWQGHEDELIGPRVQPGTEPLVEVGVVATLRLLVTFIACALRDLPLDDARTRRNERAVLTARITHQLLVAAPGSALRIVIEGTTDDGLPVDRQVRAAAATRLEACLVEGGERERSARTDLSGFFADFVDGACALVDGEDRPGMSAPRTRDGRRAVVRRASECMPDPADDFTDIPPRLRSRLQTDRLAAADVLGIAPLQAELDRLAAESRLADEATSTARALASWAARHEGSYAVEVGRGFAEQIRRVTGEVRDDAETLRSAAEQDVELPGRGERGRAFAWWFRILSGLTLAGLVTGPVLGGFGAVSSGAAVAIAAVPLVVWVLTAGSRFTHERRALLADVGRSAGLRDAEAARANVGQATLDLVRLIAGYEQYLAWSRIVGGVLHAPFGPAPERVDPPTAIVAGLPRTTRIARGVSADRDRQVAEALRRDLFRVGWLDSLWRAHRAAAAERLGPHGPAPGSRPDLHDGVPGSALASWAAEIDRLGPSRHVGDAVWADTTGSLWSGPGGLGDELLATAELDGSAGLRDSSPSTDLRTFLAGLGAAEANPTVHTFDLAHLTSTARAAGRTRVVEHHERRSVDGLSQVLVAVQLGEVRPPHEFAATAPAAAGARPAEPAEHSPPPFPSISDPNAERPPEHRDVEPSRAACQEVPPAPDGFA